MKKKMRDNNPERYIEFYPQIKQVEMMNEWLSKGLKQGDWYHSGLVDATDKTVVLPQLDASYGYCWYTLGDEPLIVYAPQDYPYFSAVSIFDMNHFVPLVVPNPARPIVIKLAGMKDPRFYSPFALLSLALCGG